MKKRINVLSLFDGMSCGQIALNRSGFEIENYYASEIDKHAIKVTQHNFPNTIQLGDVKKLDANTLPEIDILIGGSPCQNFSFSGKRKGMSTKDNIEILSLEQYLKLKEENFEFEGQSYLFWEYMRILKEVNPKYFLLENVVMSKKWKDILTQNIGAEPSNLVSAQNRKRLYWTNITNIKQPEDKGILLKDILEISTKKEYDEIEINRRKSQKRWGNHFGTIETRKHPTLCAIGKSDVILFEDLQRKTTPIECERLQTVPDNYTSVVSDSQRYKMIGNGWTVDVISHILNHINKETII